MIIKLTQQFINNNLQCPEGKSRVEFCDSELPGLYVEVRATGQGQGTWYKRYKDASGKTCHQKIARTTDIGLVEARKRARTLHAEITLGADPRGEEKARKAVLTFKEFFEINYLYHKKLRKRSWARDEELYRLRIKKVFGHKRLNEITRQQVQSFHTALKEEGLAAATCNHHIKLMKHALNLAIDWGMLDKNPVARVPLYFEDNRVENYLEQHELERLLNVLRTDENRSVCLIVLFLLSTGARLNEALRATWNQIDRQTRVWRIPASNSKSKRVRAIPLNDSAIEVLSQLDTEGKFEYLFINAKTKLPYVTIHKVWERLRKKTGIPHVRIHDVRHAFASFLINSGRTLYEVQQILGHSSPIVTQRYAHLSTKSLQDAANTASIKIKEATANSM